MLTSFSFMDFVMHSFACTICFKTFVSVVCFCCVWTPSSLMINCQKLVYGLVVVGHWVLCVCIWPSNNLFLWCFQSVAFTQLYVWETEWEGGREGECMVEVEGVCGEREWLCGCCYLIPPSPPTLPFPSAWPESPSFLCEMSHTGAKTNSANKVCCCPVWWLIWVIEVGLHFSFCLITSF